MEEPALGGVEISSSSKCGLRIRLDLEGQSRDGGGHRMEVSGDEEEEPDSSLRGVREAFLEEVC